MKWTMCEHLLPPEGKVVNTIIIDQGGNRNEQTLKRRGRLWFVPDGTSYVYYTPTHWRTVEVKHNAHNDWDYGDDYEYGEYGYDWD